MLFSCLKELNKRNPILPKELIDRKKFNPDHPKASEKLRKILHDSPNPKLTSVRSSFDPIFLACN